MELIERVLADLEALGIEATQPTTGTITARLPSQSRGEVAVHLAFEERSVSLQAFVMRGPDRAHEAVYRRLLSRHFDRSRWRFALDQDGDIFLVARSEIDGFQVRLDGLLGELTVLVDETYEGTLRTGFVVPDEVSLRRPG
jgi:hypothetical protein